MVFHSTYNSVESTYCESIKNTGYTFFGKFFTFILQGRQFLTSCLPSCTLKPFQKGEIAFVIPGFSCRLRPF